MIQWRYPSFHNKIWMDSQQHSQVIGNNHFKEIMYFSNSKQHFWGSSAALDATVTWSIKHLCIYLSIASRVHIIYCANPCWLTRCLNQPCLLYSVKCHVLYMDGLLDIFLHLWRHFKNDAFAFMQPEANWSLSASLVVYQQYEVWYCKPLWTALQSTFHRNTTPPQT